MEGGFFNYLIILGVIIFGFYVLYAFVPLGLWLRARIAGAKITLLDLIDMKIRRVPPSPIVRSMIMAAKAGIEIQLDELEDHSMAGGDVEHVVSGMISSRNRNEPLSFKEACVKDPSRKHLKNKTPKEHINDENKVS